MKKSKVVTIIVILIILVIVVAVLMLFYNRFNTMARINELHDLSIEYRNLNNYSYTVTVTNKESSDSSVSKYVLKDGEFSVEIVSNNEGKENVTNAYCDGVDDLIYIDSNGQKYVSVNKSENINTINIIPIQLTEFGKEVYASDVSKIEDYNYNDKECNLITLTNSDSQYVVEKNTGIVIAILSDTSKIDLSYDIGNVTDDDIVKQDKSEFLNA